MKKSSVAQLKTSLRLVNPSLSKFHHRGDFVLSPASNLHYLKGLVGRAEAWRSFSELEAVFAHSGRQNDTAREKQHTATQLNLFQDPAAAR